MVNKWGLPKPLGEMPAKKIEQYIIIANTLYEKAQEEQERATGKERTR